MFSNIWIQRHRKKRSHVPTAQRRFAAMRQPNRIQSFQNYRKFDVNMSTLATAPVMASTNVGRKSYRRMATQARTAIRNGHQNRCIYAHRPTSDHRQTHQQECPHINSNKRKVVHRHRLYHRPAITINRRVFWILNLNDPPRQPIHRRRSDSPTAVMVVIPTGMLTNGNVSTMDFLFRYYPWIVSNFFTAPDRIIISSFFCFFQFLFDILTCGWDTVMKRLPMEITRLNAKSQKTNWNL